MLTFLAVTAIAIVRLRSLFAVVMLSGVYSLLSASIFVLLDAVDVAFTEAAVGAGVTTVLMLGTLALTEREEKVPHRIKLLPLLVVVATGAALIYGSIDIPHFGSAAAPAHGHVAPEYLADAVKQVGRGRLVGMRTAGGVISTVTLATFWTSGTGLSGSPFDPVTVNGKTLIPGQSNNVYIFPGMGLGVTACRIRSVSDEMFLGAARAVAGLVTQQNLDQGRLFPELDQIREVSLEIGVAISRLAFEQGFAGIDEPDDLREYIASRMYEPNYDRPA